MQDAELFFQAADHRHLFLYLDALAASVARRQANVEECAQRSRDEYQHLYARIERLECELQQEKDENALLRHQISLESRRTAAANALLADMQNDLAAALGDTARPPVSACASLYADMVFLREKLQRTQTFPLFQEDDPMPSSANPAQAKDELWQNYLRHLGIEDMREILTRCQSSADTLATLPPSAAGYFSPLPDIQRFFVMLIDCLDAVGNAAAPGGSDTFAALRDDIRSLAGKIERAFREQEQELVELFAVLYAFFKKTEIPARQPEHTPDEGGQTH